MKQLLAVFLLLVIVALAAALTKNNTISIASLEKLFHTSTVIIKNQTFYVLVAQTEAEREKGLSGKNNLPQNEGMIFLFDHPDYYGFWMKDMKFPIDIIFIRDNAIVTVYNNMQPPTNKETLPIIKPSEPADKVLEINAGLAAKYHMQTGDTISLSL